LGIELGHIVVGPVARLTRALDVAPREAIEVAVLDVNIYGEASYPIADVLAARGIPFIFSTGYGRLLPQYRNHPTLEEPFRLDDLQRSLADVLP
jgi:hypothetical protein